MNMCGQMIMNKNNEKGQVKYPRAILSHNSNPCTVWGKSASKHINQKPKRRKQRRIKSHI
ncbi:hypothetical protein OIU74_026713 [Salix koriyanagi]|uniref:Uncharacterized protein n=1 Tax=Salix koriyanagi TaxID=2511006 RepID=A0A9Q0W1F3_9ROSI|nr:hypothetical protein OIU74_026713 [Salix koriyanagi]